MSRIWLHLVIFTSLYVTRPCSAGTLRDLLLSYKVPAVAYTERQLLESVQGTGLLADGRAVIAYRVLNGDVFAGPLQALEYDFAPKATRTSSLLIDPNDVCLGSPEHVYSIDGDILVSTGISPSAECLLFLDDRLEIRGRFFGFSPVEFAPHHIAIVEDMIHFASVHPERMEVIDLSTSATDEIYPPANDPLREQLALEHAKKMPPSEICARMDDPCAPKLFDESSFPVATDGGGHLAFVVAQTAYHALAENTEPETVAEQLVLYNYAHAKGHWYYCEELIQKTELNTLQAALKDHFDVAVTHHCHPDRLVVPDKDSGFNPFRDLSKRARVGQKSSVPPKRWLRWPKGNGPSTSLYLFFAR